MKKLINLIALVMLVSTNVLTPFSYADLEDIGELEKIEENIETTLENSVINSEELELEENKNDSKKISEEPRENLDNHDVILDNSDITENNEENIGEESNNEMYGITEEGKEYYYISGENGDISDFQDNRINGEDVMINGGNIEGIDQFKKSLDDMEGKNGDNEIKIQDNLKKGEILDEKENLEGQKNHGIIIMTAVPGSSVTLLPGSEFPCGGGVTQIIQTGTIPEGVEINEISVEGSEYPVYARNTGGIMYYATQAETIYLNSDSSRMFSSCDFEVLDLSDWDASNVTKMTSMFNSSSNLKKLDLSNWDTSNVMDMGSMFAQCGNLEELDLSGWNFSKYNFSIGNMTYVQGLPSLKKLNMSNTKGNLGSSAFALLNNIKELNLNGADFGSNVYLQGLLPCGKLEKLDLGGWDFSKITNPNLLTYISRNQSGCPYLKKLNMENTKYGSTMSGTFQGLTNLEEINLSGANTSNVTDMRAMFYGCSNLTGLDLSSFDTSKVTNMQSMFYGCSGLQNLNLDNRDLRQSTNGSSIIGGMFNGASNIRRLSAKGWKLPTTFTHAMGGRTSSLSSSDIQEIDVTDWDLSNTTDIQGLFGDSKVRIIKGLDTWNTSGVINMSTMFENCSNLTELDLSGWNTSKVTNMSNMFKNCSNLAELDLSSWDTSKVTSIGAGNGGMFGGCNSLEKLNLSGRDFRGYSNSSLMMNLMGGTPQSLTKLNMTNTKYTGNATYAFGGLNKIEELKLEGTDTSGVTRMEAMFNGDSKLISLDLSSFDTSNVGNMGGIFGGCSKLEEINLSGWDFRNLNNASLMMNLMGGTPQSLTKLNMTNTKYTGNAYYALGGLNKLEEIKLEGVDTSGVTGMQSMFSGNVNLTELDLSSFDTSNVTNMSQMFYGCSNLIELDLSSFDTSNVTNMPQMFYGCSGLQNLNLDNRDLRQSTNGSSIIGGMFNGASNIIKLSAKGWKLPTTFTHAMGGRTSSLGANTLEELDVTDWDLSNTIDIQGLFGDSKVRIIKGLDTWNTSGVTNMGGMFQNCSNLTGLDLSSFDTSNVTSMGGIFGGCNQLEEINLSGRDFRKCNNSSLMMNLTAGGIPSLKKLNMTNTKYTGNVSYAFGGLSKLEGIKLDGANINGVTGMYAMFSGDSSLINLDLSNLDTKNVIDMGNMFYNCSSLTGLDLSNFDTSNVTSMGGIFGGCNQLEEINLSGRDFRKYNNSSLVMNLTYGSSLSLKKLNMTNTKYTGNASYAFGGLSKLEDIKLDGVNTSGVTGMQSMFDGDSKITGLDLSSFDIGNVANMSVMFQGCSSLEKIKLDGWDVSKNPLGGILANAPNLKKISMKEWKIPESFTHGLSRSWAGGSSLIEEIDVTDWDLSKTKEIQGLFADSKGLKTIKGLSTWNTSGVQNMNQLFYNCSNLTGLELSSFDTSNVNNMGQMFQGCSGLNNLDLSNFDTKNVNDMNSIFAGCSGLTGLVLDGWDITNVTSMGGFIGNTPNLKKISMKEWKISESLTHGLSRGWGGGSSPIEEIDVTDWDLSKTKEIQGLFADSKGLKTIKGLNTWNTSGVQNMNQLFQNCSNLTGLELSSFNTSNVTDMGNMFLGCSGLNELDLSNFDTSKVTTLGQMFYNTPNLKTIYASENFVTTALSGDTSSKDMFSGTISVVGGNGTKFDPNYIDEEYAKIDKVGQTGYFTDKFLIAVKFINTLDGTETLSTFAKGQKLTPPSVDGYHVVGGYLDEEMTQEVDLSKGVDSYSEIYVKYERNESSGGSSGGGGVKPATPKEEQKPADASEQVPQNDNSVSSGATVYPANLDEEPENTTSIDSSTSSQNDGKTYSTEFQQAYEFAKGNGITTMPTIQKAQMDGKLTRIAMAKMLSQYAINVLGQTPDTSKKIRFKDVTKKKDAEYDNGVTLAYQLGIMGQNMPNNKFRPDDEVPRAEFVAALSRMLYNTSDGEYKSTREYYIPHMAKLYNEGIISNRDPSMAERRGYVMLMLMRSAK